MIPLEDNVGDIIGKAQRGLNLSDEQLAEHAGISLTELNAARAGDFGEPLIRKVAPVLKLGTDALVALSRKTWYPEIPGDVPNLASSSTAYRDMMVNSYLVWDPATRNAAAFDTGTDAGPLLKVAAERNLTIKLILLTHTHGDHIADLTRLRSETGAPAFVGEHEAFPDAAPVRHGKVFSIGELEIEARQTSGHARGGITYIVTGLPRKIAVVGDALFAGSMGGGMISYEEALRTNRESIFTLPDDTILCPGHGPLTTVGEERMHNPFFPEFQKS